MLSQQTITQLRQLRLSDAMDSIKALEATPQAPSMAHDEWFGHIVAHLYEVKMAAKLDNLIKGAHLGCPGAFIEDINTDPDRGINPAYIADLAAGSYIKRGHNIVLLSAAGGGKTWLASAFGLSACRQYVKVQYLNYRDMLDELSIARKDPAKHEKLVKRLSNVPLLIIDDWLLKESDIGDMDELFSVVDGRAMNRKPSIFCSQYLIGGWPERMGGYPAAESVVDRIKNNAHVIELKGDTSMRERYMDEELKKYDKQ